MSMNPPNLGADLPLRFGAVSANQHSDPVAAMSVDVGDTEWPALPDQPHEHDVASPRLLTPAVLRVLEWHRARSTAPH